MNDVWRCSFLECRTSATVGVPGYRASRGAFSQFTAGKLPRTRCKQNCLKEKPQTPCYPRGGFLFPAEDRVKGKGLWNAVEF